MRFDRAVVVTVFSLVLLSAQPSPALFGFDFEFDWEGSRAERVVARSVDAVIVRPISFVRIMVGAGLFVPAALLAAPGGRESVDDVFDTFLRQPVEYTFRRELGDF